MLERSMDEIFALAKDAQEAFDYAHENGKLSDEGDEWTYEVWVDQQE